MTISVALVPAPAAAAATPVVAWNLGNDPLITSFPCVQGGSIKATINYTDSAGNTAAFTCELLTNSTVKLTSTQASGCPNQPEMITVQNYTTATTAVVTTYQFSSQLGCNPVNKTVNFSKDSSGKVQTYNVVTNNNGGGSGGGGSTPPAPQCPIDGTSGINWILCPVWGLASGTLQLLTNAIENQLYFNTDQVFGTIGTQAGFQTVFNVFRNIAMGLLVIAGLVMVISQAAGLEIFAAYTVRKALPRIVMATIGIALAWPLLLFVITFFNDIGSLISSIMLAAVKVPSTGGNPLAQVGGSVVDIVLGAGAGAAVVVFFGGVGVLLLAVSIVIGLLFGLIVLVIRQLVIITAILLAPLAIAASVLPGTERLWKLWRSTLLSALAMFPIIMGFLSVGAVLAYIAEATANASRGTGGNGGGQWDLLAICAYFAPFFFIWYAFQLAGGVTASAAAALNGFRTKNVENRLGHLRQEERKRIHQERMEGRTPLSSTWFGAQYRRVFSPDAGGIGSAFTRAGRIRYNQYDRKRLGLVAANIAQKEAAGFGSGNDTANEIAVQEGMTGERFEQEYAGRLRRQGYTGDADQEAANVRGLLESSYHAHFGSTAMRLGAWKALTNSTTSYRGRDFGENGDIVEGHRRMYQDATSLIRGGYLTAAEAGSDIKFSNPNAAGARRERAGDGYGAMVSDLDQLSRPNPATGAYRNVTRADVEAAEERSLYGNDPGDFLRGRPETLKAFAPILAKHVADTAAAAELRPNDLGAQQAYEDQLAQVNAMYTYLQGVSQEKADIFAHNVMSRVVGPAGTLVPIVPATNTGEAWQGKGTDVPAPTNLGAKQISIRERIDKVRANRFFMDKVYNYQVAYGATGANNPQQNPTGGAPQPGAPVAPLPGQQ